MMDIPPRILKETQRLAKEPVPGVVCVPDENNFRKFSAKFDGPAGSPYEGGVFDCVITLPEEYPNVPPEVDWKTPIYHPNIMAGEVRKRGEEKIVHYGPVCMDLLVPGLDSPWNSALQVRAVLLSIQNLLAEPDLDDLLYDAPEIGLQWKDVEGGGREAAIKTAKEWTEKHAKS